MIALDSNVLIAAHRREHPLHSRAMSRILQIAEGDLPWCLPVFCLAEFLRVLTHPRVFTPPTSLEVVLAFIDGLLESPTIRVLFPGDQFWYHLRSKAINGDARGNLIFDAQIAALCQEFGAMDLVTADRDFTRFGGLRPDFL